MRCGICGKEFNKHIYIYHKSIVCHDCVHKECSDDFDNYLYIDSYFRDEKRFMIVYQNNLYNYKKKLKDYLVMYSKTKKLLYKHQMEYYSKKIDYMEGLLK